MKRDQHQSIDGDEIKNSARRAPEGDRMTWAYFLKLKSADKVGEFVSNELVRFRADRGIHQEFANTRVS